MADLRRASLTAGFLMLCFLPTGCQMRQAAADASPPSVRVMNGMNPGSFRIVNEGIATVSLNRDVIIETRTHELWQAVAADLKLTASCTAAMPHDCLRLEPGQTFEPVAWSGLGCGAQCAPACRADIYYGPGEFRFVISDCAKKQRWYGPVFKLPANH